MNKQPISLVGMILVYSRLITIITDTQSWVRRKKKLTRGRYRFYYSQFSYGILCYQTELMRD